MSMSSLPYWLAALYLPGIGPLKLKQWLTHFADIKTLFTATDEECQAVGISAKDRAKLQQPNWQAVEADLAWAEQEDHHLLTWDDERYPMPLKEIADPPILLFVRGNPAVLSSKQIALVGSRHATPAGIRNAHYFAHSLAEAGLTITSGLALGIDGASHRGALAAKGKTIAVFGTGLQHIYPAQHVSLVQEIIQGEGAVISEFPLNTSPKPPHFPQRNRIIGGLSVGVLVVEAALKSGSLITARHALEQGREVFAIPGSIHHPLSKGCHHLIRQGAKLVETAADVLEELGGLSVSTSTRPLSMTASNDACLPPESQQVLAQIDYEITPLDLILLRSGLTMGQVSSILLTLELQGYVQSIPGGYIKAA